MAGPLRPVATPEELAALDELARLLEQYHSYLLARHGFANATRALASSAAGTARPAIERLAPHPAADLARLEEALRAPDTETARHGALASVETAVRDLRALMAAERYRRTAAPAAPAAALPSPSPSAADTGFGADPKSQVDAWLGAITAAGLLALAFGTDVFDRGTNPLMAALAPVISACSGGVIGNLIYQHGVRQTMRRRLGTVLACSVMLIIAVPEALESARTLIGLDLPAAARPGQADGGDVPPPAAREPAAPAAAPPAMDLRANPIPPAAKLPTTISGGTGGATDGGTKAPAVRNPPRPLSAETATRCTALNERASLGETLSPADQRFLAEQCRS
jgi:hypothetical protein